MAKASKNEMRERENDIVSLVALGFNRGDISKELAPKHRVSEKSIERQYDNIISNWVKVDRLQQENARAAYIFQLNKLYKDAYAAGQWKVAADIVEKQAKMMGLYLPKAQELEEKPTINIVPRSLAVVPKSGNGE